ncbi:hypothetical protein PAT3040_04172 [Paenibacillus agaridevorans]|uniref:Uncharacterized protein n=1 Tax=Paenibacillus agaridevorans TaxID=171404 RepID=A0A2R5ES55_9BACL|nr:hypothetical protein [Paenibacillus agaridevorans]GBG09522.1 hypothetical protein PAT3040_04172 [Paenibacillus agaridevorans]
MAVINQKLIIEADPNRPKEEIANIITGFLQLWPGSEVMILKAVQADIGQAIELFEKKGEGQRANDVFGDGQQSSHGAGGGDHGGADVHNRP